MTTKVCSKCKVEKELGEFYKSRSSCDGLDSRCKQCSYARVTTWRATNPEKVKGYDAAWRAANPEKVKAKSVAWLTANPEKVKGYDAAWRAANPEKVKAKNKAYRAKITETLEYPYIKHLLDTPNLPQELIELKRIQIRIHREIYKKGDAES